MSKEKAGSKSAISFENEVLIMKSVQHRNLIKLEEVFETKKVKTPNLIFRIKF